MLAHNPTLVMSVYIKKEWNKKLAQLHNNYYSSLSLCCVCPEVELNLAVDNVQTLNHWKQLNDLFPLTLNTRDPSQLESVMYRYVS